MKGYQSELRFAGTQSQRTEETDITSKVSSPERLLTEYEKLVRNGENAVKALQHARRAPNEEDQRLPTTLDMNKNLARQLEQSKKRANEQKERISTPEADNQSLNRETEQLKQCVNQQEENCRKTEIARDDLVQQREQPNQQQLIESHAVLKAQKKQTQQQTNLQERPTQDVEESQTMMKDTLSALNETTAEVDRERKRRQCGQATLPRKKSKDTSARMTEMMTTLSTLEASLEREKARSWQQATLVAKLEEGLAGLKVHSEQLDKDNKGLSSLLGSKITPRRLLMRNLIEPFFRESSRDSK
ncbi:Fc.00g105590.m01.CDS01 [Cosmosporella sp. VM-42]